jgi:hypothetical protein
MHASFLPSLKDLGRMIAASSEVKLRPTRHAFQTTGSLSLPSMSPSWLLTMTPMPMLSAIDANASSTESSPAERDAPTRGEPGART